MDLRWPGVHGTRELVARKEASPLEVLEAALAAIDAHDGTVHAFLDVHREQAMARARELGKQKNLSDLPLAGVPVAIKDNICVAGERTTCASRILENYRSPYDATIVERLRAAGAVIVGKTNLDEFAMGSSTENSAFGVTHNPWDPARAPGGSSGGSAAAVAAGMVPAAFGSDTGGSIRQPASFCGVVGLKPTYGRVSRYGLVAFASSLDQIGPVARSVRDAAMLLGAVAGRDARDATSLDDPVGDLTSALERGLDGLTVGVPWSFLRATIDADVLSIFEKTLSRVEGAGHTVREVELPHASYATETYYIVANAEASANLARFDGVRYGMRAEDSVDLFDMYTRTRDNGFGSEVKRRILLGTYALSAGYYDAYYHKAQQVRSLIIRDFARAFEGCQLLMLPTAPTPAFGIGEKIDDPVMMYLNDIFTIPVNLAGLPAISIPAGLSSRRLPVGVQLIAPALAEETLLRGAFGIERLVDFKERAL